MASKRYGTTPGGLSLDPRINPLSARIDRSMAGAAELRIKAGTDLSGEAHDAKEALTLWRYCRPEEFERKVDGLLAEVRSLVRKGGWLVAK
jgi:hypothetical protein